MIHDAGAHLHTVGSVAEACAPWTRVSTPSSRMAGRHVGTSVARSALLPWYPCSTPQPRYRSPLQAVSPTLAGARTGSWRLGGIALDVVSRVERSGREDQARGGICVTVGEGEVGGGKLLGPERVPDLDMIAQGRVVAYVRTVKMPSGATAVQIVYGKRRGAHCMEHIGSAHDEQELEALKAAARQRLAVGQQGLEARHRRGRRRGRSGRCGSVTYPSLADGTHRAART
jgi:hypothetical protein